VSLVRIARFADPSEAQVVAAALRASGIHVFLQNEHTGQIEFLWQQALGGFGIMVDEEDAKDAAAFIRQHRRPPDRRPKPGLMDRSKPWPMPMRGTKGHPDVGAYLSAGWW